MRLIDKLPKLPLLLLLASAPLWALTHGERHYVADEHSSRWEGEFSPLFCELRHEVPGFGTAHFSKVAGGGLEMTINVSQQPLHEGEAQLSSRPPSWRHGVNVRQLGEVSYQSGDTPFIFDELLSRRLLSELEQGMFPTLEFPDGVDGRDRVTLALSAVRVRDALKGFRGCMAELLPFQYDEVNFSRFFFGFNKWALDNEMRERLIQVARYMNADETVVKAKICGFTDSRGFRRYNQMLSERRGNSVRDFLIEQGVAADRLDVCSHGESDPLATNRTVSGRANNRRVDVRLLR